MEGVEGLIHVSEMDVEDGQNPEETHPPGTEVTVKILNIDSEERKVSLSMKAAKEGGSAPPYKNYLNNDSGGGTLGDILGESLAAAKGSEEQPAEEIVEPEDADPVETEAAEEAGDEQEKDVEASAPEIEEEVEVEPEDAEPVDENQEPSSRQIHGKALAATRRQVIEGGAREVSPRLHLAHQLTTATRVELGQQAWAERIGSEVISRDHRCGIPHDRSR